MDNQKTLDELFLETMEKAVIEKIAALEEPSEVEKVAGRVRAWMGKASMGKKVAAGAAATAATAAAGYGAHRAIKAFKNRKKKK